MYSGGHRASCRGNVMLLALNLPLIGLLVRFLTIPTTFLALIYDLLHRRVLQHQEFRVRCGLMMVSAFSASAAQRGFPWRHWCVDHLGAS